MSQIRQGLLQRDRQIISKCAFTRSRVMETMLSACQLIQGKLCNQLNIAVILYLEGQPHSFCMSPHLTINHSGGNSSFLFKLNCTKWGLNLNSDILSLFPRSCKRQAFCSLIPNFFGKKNKTEKGRKAFSKLE